MNETDGIKRQRLNKDEPEGIKKQKTTAEPLGVFIQKTMEYLYTYTNGISRYITNATNIS